MKIKKFEVVGLFDYEKPITINLNEDLNILSGRNGAGKTTILKLMWYLISGNFDKAAAEIKFNSAKVITDKYELTVKINYSKKDQPFETNLKLSNISDLKNYEDDPNLSKIIQNNAKNFNKNYNWFLTQYIDSSFFLPTFRMIEGGFMTEKYDIKHDLLKEFYLNINQESDFSNVENSLKKLSTNLTKRNHKFITSISAKEIDIFLVKKYAEIMKKVNVNQKENLKFLSEKLNILLKKSDNEIEKNSNSEKLLELNDILHSLNSENAQLNEPIYKLRSALRDFIPHYNIEFDQKVYFSKIDESESKINDLDSLEDGDYELGESSSQDKNSLTISCLSAGEKQLLTFVAYNIFYSNTIFFIDEPELSLHVDWQSKLFSLLKEQNSSNQFIISTHSPFIYGIFPDKEIVINSDKGCKGL
jgi:predicted ATPase